MKRLPLLLVLVLAGTFAWAQSQNGKTELNLPDPPMLGLHWARGVERAVSPFGSPRSPNLTYHNGNVLTSPTVTIPILWGAKWGDTSTGGFVGDKVTGLNTWYLGATVSSYAATNTEYKDSSGLNVSPSIPYSDNSLIVDTAAAPSGAPSTSTILNKVCSELSTKGISPTPNGYYPVYVDTPRGNANYCAWHSWGSCNAVPIEFGFFFNLDGDPGCDPQDTSTIHSQGLEALANVSGHELSETLTDPRGSAWYDSSGYENADKCAWTFGTPELTFSNGSQWKIQGNWSNAAYNAGTGYPNSKGQKGCIDGGNYK